jgi:hypothetical protein
MWQGRHLLAALAIAAAAGPLPAAIPQTERSAHEAYRACVSHLNSLVMYLEETAALEGTLLRVEWRRDGSVLLHYDDHSQRMWCQDDELHIECGPAAPDADGRTD